MPRYEIERLAKLTEGTAKILARLDRACFPLDDPEPHEGRTWWLCYEVRGKHRTPVGYAALKLITGGYAFLARAGVKKAHRRRGLHRRLIAVRIRHAKASGLAGVITYTSKENTASSNSLVRSGFKLYWPQEPWAGADKVYFVKRLTA